MFLAALFLASCSVYEGLSDSVTDLVFGQPGSPWTTGDNDYYYDPLNPEDTFPVITSSSRSFSIQQGDSVILPCVVQNLEEYSLIWRHGNQILWVLQHRPDGPIVEAVSQDHRIGLNGTSLMLSRVQWKDAGTYTCELSTQPRRTLNHTLTVRVPPSVYPANNRSEVTIRIGSTVTLGCHASGYPTPTVTWTRKGGNLPGPAEGANLTVHEAVPEDNGVYKCTATNGVGKPASTSIILQVMHRPKVWAEKEEVYSGVGYEATIACYVEAEPRPQVKFYRLGDIPVDPLRLYKTFDVNNRYSLHFDHVQLSDFGYHTCNASNFIGNSSAIIRLSGRPKPVRFTSLSQGDKENTYTLVWDVESYAPVLAYIIAYRNESDGEDEGIKLTVPGTTSSSIYHSYSHNFTQLEPGATYYVQVTAKNEFGLSDVNETFTFTTFDPAGPDSPEDYDAEGEDSLSVINQYEDVVSEAVGVSQLQADPTPSMDAATSPNTPSIVAANLTEQQQIQKKVSTAEKVHDDSSGAFTFTMTPAERRGQMVALVTAISLSCFFS
ncbi:protein amalgam isoform X1 [Cherax quadricarinatus]|uniref:protein amalgam isoform X1 n=1 Tax=Cherax quadricarinatus TaxID=27406 RepID=UPI00387EC0D7